MSIKDVIGSDEVQNLGGTRAGRGFAYQNHWSIKKLIELHSSGSDYVMLFEVYDDVSILDREINPKALEVYQVKSSQNSSPITLSNLCTQVKGGPSILAKLVMVKEGLPKELKSATERLHIVSNASFKHKSKYHSSPDKAVKLTEHYKDGVEDKLETLSTQSKLAKKDIEEVLEITFLIKSPLAFDEPDRQIRDLLQEFFKNHFEHFDLEISPFYQRLLAEVERKCNADKKTGYEETLKSKGITKSWLDAVLKDISPDTKHKLKFILSDLQKEGWSAEKLFTLEKAWVQMEIDNLSDEEYHNGKVLKSLDKIIPNYSSGKEGYSNDAESILIELKTECTDGVIDKSDYYLRSLILWQMLNYRIKALGD